MKVAVTLYALVGATSVLRKIGSEYLFNTEAKKGADIVETLLLAVLPYLLWAVSNWCLTSLMDGEGGLRDMIMATGYALSPLILSNVLYTALSWVLVQQEGNYIYLIQTVGVLWTCCWVFFAMMITQQYTLGKSMGTALLTIVGMALMVFVFLLLFYLLQQVYSFFLDLYMEILFRFNF